MRIAFQNPMIQYARRPGAGFAVESGRGRRKSISSGAEAQTQAQTQARQRSSGIVSTFKRLMGSETTTGKNKLGQ